MLLSCYSIWRRNTSQNASQWNLLKQRMEYSISLRYCSCLFEWIPVEYPTDFILLSHARNAFTFQLGIFPITTLIFVFCTKMFRFNGIVCCGSKIKKAKRMHHSNECKQSNFPSTKNSSIDEIIVSQLIIRVSYAIGIINIYCCVAKMWTLRALAYVFTFR